MATNWMVTMALFEGAEKSGYEIVREGEDVILKIDCEKTSYSPSLEDSPLCMADTVEKLAETGPVTKIVFSHKRDYEYDTSQTQMMYEIAKLYNLLIKQKNVLGYYAILNPGCESYATARYNELQHSVFQLLKSDPLGCYVELRRILRREKISLAKSLSGTEQTCIRKYISLLGYTINLLENSKLVQMAKSYLGGYKLGDREPYRKIFYPAIKPDFMFTKLQATYPADAEELDTYIVDDTEVTIFALPDSIQNLYHIVPPEFKLTEDKYDLLDVARQIMSEHKPKRSEFVDPKRMREVFYNVGHDLIEELALYRNVKLREKELDQLTQILVRYTVGFGLVEVILKDDKIQDITINSPMGRIPMFVVHAEYSDCMTNIIPTESEAESWASKLRLVSGRPLDEANPILDTELELPGANARVAVIGQPLNPTGLAYAFRRHRDKPWTLPLFIKNRMINPMAAGLISFLVDGSRTMLVAGTRSAGKSSLLGAVMVEIMRKYRMITIEDTLELPTSALRNLGYNVQSMKVASALTKGTSEVTAEEGIRTTLRLGDSALIVGEVRSSEATSLYEAMRVGALANVVAGTIHGDSPYGVYDRVVNDLKVPKTSFKATDVVIVANPLRSADGLHRWRRVTQITEIRKKWENDPLLEGGFVDLMKYDSGTDELEPSQDIINGDSEVLKGIAGNVKDWAGNWDAMWENIMLRSQMKKELFEYSEKVKLPDMLEAPFVIQANDAFHKISDKVKEEGGLDNERIHFEWTEWMKGAVKKTYG